MRNQKAIRSSATSAGVATTRAGGRDIYAPRSTTTQITSTIEYSKSRKLSTAQNFVEDTTMKLCFSFDVEVVEIVEQTSMTAKALYAYKLWIFPSVVYFLVFIA